MSSRRNDNLLSFCRNFMHDAGKKILPNLSIGKISSEYCKTFEDRIHTRARKTLCRKSYRKLYKKITYAISYKILLTNTLFSLSVKTITHYY